MDSNARPGRSSSERWLRLRIALGLVLLTAVLLVGIAVQTGRLLESSIRSEALHAAQTSAHIFAELTLEDQDFEGGRLTGEGAAELEDALGESDEVSAVRIWDRRLQIAYASGELRASREPHRDDLRGPLAGAPRTQVTSLVAEGGLPVRGATTEEQVEVSLPLVTREGNNRSGVVQVYLSYAAVSRGIAAKTERLYLLLAGLGVLLLLCLLPLLSRASRSLTSAYVDREPPLARELRGAIKRDELVLHYQPKVDLKTGRPTGVEALVRWQHAQRGLLGPHEFLAPLAEHDVMRPLTSWVLDTAAAQCKRWQREGHGLSVSVNVPPASLFDPEFCGEVSDVLDRWDLPAGRLVLELTEGPVAEQGDAALERLDDLHALGVRLSLDDFGTGHSSLSRLSTLPIDELKIDRSFVLGMNEGAGDLMAVRLIADFGRHLGHRVVAEGVETAENWEQLKVLGCHEAQGYLLSRPIPALELTSWLEAWIREPIELAAPDEAPPRGLDAGLLAEPVPGDALGHLIETAPEAFISTDEQGVIMAWNRAAETTFGWSRDEALGRRLAATVLPPRVWPAHEAWLRRTAATGDSRLMGKRLELVGLHRDGHEFPVEIVISHASSGGQTRFSAFMHDISERKRDERNREAEQEVARILAASAVATEAIPAVLRCVGERLGWACGALWLPDPADDRLRCGHVWPGVDSDSDSVVAMTEGWSFAKGEGLAGRVWEQAHPQWILDVLIEPVPRARTAARAGLRRFVGIPILAHGNVLGVMEFFSRTPSECDDELVRTLEAVGSQIAVFLERCREQERAREHDRQLIAVSGIVRDLMRPGRAGGIRSAICEATLAVSGAGTVVLKEPSPDGEWLVTSAAAGRSVGTPPLPLKGDSNGPAVAFRTGEPLFAPDAPNHPDLSQAMVNAAGPASLLFQPVRWQDSTRGVLVVVWREPVAAVDQHMAEALRMLSDEAAIAIEHSDLMARLERTEGVDDATGLPNRRSWEDALRRELDRADRGRQSVCVGIIDFDPPAEADPSVESESERGGDRTTWDLRVKQAAAACADRLSGTDYLGRYGQARLAVILAERSMTNARAVMAGLADLLPQGAPFATTAVEWDGFETAERLLMRAHAELTASERARF